MPKRAATPELFFCDYQMEKRQKRLSKQNDTDPLILLHQSHAIQQSHHKKSTHHRDYQWNRSNKLLRSNSSKSVGGVVHSTRRTKNSLQQVNHDTFQLMDSESPINNENAKPQAKHYQRRSNRSQTPQTNINPFRDTGYHPPQTLVEQRKSIHDALMPEVSHIPRVFISVSGDQMANFFQLIEAPIIVKFLRFDVCLRVTDKYLLAMAFAYFARAKLLMKEYTVLNFFVALYLAHDVEEDEEDYKYEIFPWALGSLWRVKYKTLLGMRDRLWKRMQYKAIVSRKCCEEIMAIEPDHPIWTRERKVHHAGAIRPWLKERHDDGKLIGPDGSPRHCDLCKYPAKSADSDHDSLSPDSDRLWLQMDSSNSSLEEYTPANLTNASSAGTAPGFSMNDMQKTLMYSSNSAKNSSGRGLSVTGDTTLDWVDCFSDIDEDRQALHRAEV